MPLFCATAITARGTACERGRHPSGFADHRCHAAMIGRLEATAFVSAPSAVRPPLGRWSYMRLVVDLSRCQGYAQCAFLAPDAFQIHGEEALMFQPNPDDAQRDQILRAAAACPVQAILVDQLTVQAAVPG
jgi:ferredoxin